MEKRIYSPWAFGSEEREKECINRLIYNELKGKFKKFYNNEPSDEEKLSFMCYRLVRQGYGTTTYNILSNPYDFTNDELALICDNGNLCFGYRGFYPTITIHTD